MADYKTYLASSVLTEDKIVCRISAKYVNITNKLTGHLQVAQSRSKDPCQCSEGVSVIPQRHRLCLTLPRMLYEFHHQQNSKKPGTVHATYLLSGTKRKEESVPAIPEAKKDGEDDHMQSSPFMTSSMPQFTQDGTVESSVLSITLVTEEKLEGKHITAYLKIMLNPRPEARSQYEHISSIHIYSIGPSPIMVYLMFHIACSGLTFPGPTSTIRHHS